MPRVIVWILLMTLSVGLYASAAVFNVNVSAQRKQRPDSSAANKAPASTPSPELRQQAESMKTLPKGSGWDSGDRDRCHGSLRLGFKSN